jgi:hypothetical protein
LTSPKRSTFVYLHGPTNRIFAGFFAGFHPLFSGIAVRFRFDSQEAQPISTAVRVLAACLLGLTLTAIPLFAGTIAGPLQTATGLLAACLLPFSLFSIPLLARFAVLWRFLAHDGTIPAISNCAIAMKCQ